MGEVYRARDTRLGREVAVKVLPERLPHRRPAEPLRAGGRAAGALNHPNILAVYDVGAHEGAPFIVDRAARGRDAARAPARGHRCRRARPSTTAADRPRSRRCARQGDRAPRPQAREPVRHRRTGGSRSSTSAWRKLRAEGRWTREAPSWRRRDRRRAVLGTVGYMSPEQARALRRTRARTSSRSAPCSTRCSPAVARSGGDTRRDADAILNEDPPELSRRGDDPGGAGAVAGGASRRGRGALPVGPRPGVRAGGGAAHVPASRRQSLRRAAKRSPAARGRVAASSAAAVAAPRPPGGLPAGVLGNERLPDFLPLTFRRGP